MTKSIVVNLLDSKDKTLYGGKATNLAILLQAGLPVPNGYSVSFQSFKNGKLSSVAKSQFSNLLDKNKLYAVRSSALMEDGANASWAGQFESFLDVPYDKVPEMAEQCHNSARLRTKSYAKEMDITTENNKVAVVVQEMLKPDYAGVLFTQDPVTKTEHMVVEYVAGIGEQLVGGTVTPELVITKDGTGVDAPFDISKLVTLAKKVEQLFGCPQDIEWAEMGGKIWLLQARPITNL